MNNDQIKQVNWDDIKNNMINECGIDNIDLQILNNKNRIITENYVCKLIKDKIGIDYVINDKKLFLISTTHDSYIKKNWNDVKNIKSIYPNNNISNGDNNVSSRMSRNDVVPLQEISYERLEFFGDALLRVFSSDYLVCRYDEFGPGELTDTRALIENRKAFSEISKKISLNKYLLISKNYEILHTREKDDKMLCDLFESFICALFYDICKIKYSDLGKNKELMNIERGVAYQICWYLFVKLVEEELNIPSLLENDTNYKKKLLIEYHKLNWTAPVYRLMQTKNDEKQTNKKYYKTGVYDNDKNIIGIGYSSSKNTSEKISAKNALQHLNVLENNKEEIEEIPSNSELIYYK
jgi:dsRNA-specific ribonuclease